MSSINDWAAKAAERIDDEYPHARRKQRPSTERIAAIIATFAEPLMAMLREAKREHSRGYLSEESDHPPCKKSHEDYAEKFDGPCTCGADAWNAKIDTVLAGETP
jgi:hypothetical protein